jgi:hypothetical protein
VKKLIVLSILLFSIDSYAACGPFGCFMPGTTCINDECVSNTIPTPIMPVPTPVPTPIPPMTISEIRLDSKPNAEILAVVFDCSTMNLKNLKIYLKRKVPPPTCSYYSFIFFNVIDIEKKPRTNYFFARKDVENNYTFLYMDLFTEEPRPQSIGSEFVFTQWENPAFTDFFKNKTCEELKASEAFFGYGLSIKDNRLEYEGAIFTFR